MRGRIDRPKYNGLGSGGGRHRFDGPIVLDRGGAFGYTVREIPRNDLLTSVAEPGAVAVA
jgi:starch phosphorylase